MLRLAKSLEEAALVLECTPAYDLPGEEDISPNVALGPGPGIYVMDSGTFQDPRLVAHIARTAVNHGIPYQIRRPGGGGTNTAAIQRDGDIGAIVTLSGSKIVPVPGLFHDGGDDREENPPTDTLAFGLQVQLTSGSLPFTEQPTLVPPGASDIGSFTRMCHPLNAGISACGSKRSFVKRPAARPT